MYDIAPLWTRIRRRLPWWGALVAAGLGWSSVAVAHQHEAAEAGHAHEGVEAALPVTAGDRPTRAAPHADCDHRMPLYEHTVEKGEHLGLIAGRYGVRYREVVALNPQLADPDLIRPGDAIRVCPEIFPRLTKRIEHVVAAGETLGKIATRYGLTVEVLIAQQDGAIGDPNMVRVGQSLSIEVDGGLVPDFLPPPPPKKAKSKSKKRRSPGKRSKISVALPSSEHLLIKRPNLAYGTAKTINLLQRAVSQYRGRHRGAPRVVVGDISKRGGGKIPPHLSHQTGRDIDLGYVVKGGASKRFTRVNAQTLDVARTWALLQSFLNTGQVVYIFVDFRLQKLLYEHAKAKGVPQRKLEELFQYPHGRGRARGIIRHWPSHRNHFHVRFRS